MKKALKNKKGFTLVELMVVVAIMAVLVAVAIPVYNSVTTKAEESTCATNIRTIESAIMQYGISKPAAGVKMTDLVGTYLAEEPKCPTDGKAYDIVGGKVTCPNKHKKPNTTPAPTEKPAGTT